MKKPEILAPAGSPDAFYAAMASGADAIYLAGNAFGARAYADNFGPDGLQAVIRYAHLRGRKVYVTVNTLIKDAELPQALAECAHLWAWGADALIVQDWGLLAQLHKNLPQLPLSGSTQMSIHNSVGVAQAARWGVERVILARETSLADLKTICQKATVECETFVHGALCICYSGQCLFSSLVGGRSGNRGRCAQPCRLSYTCVNGKGVELGQGHLLSPKDFCGYGLLGELMETGAASFKLEGRMKRPEYVATVTDVYAKGVQQGDFVPEAAAEKRLEQAFNREFTTGFLLGQEGRDMMSYQRPSNRGSKLGKVEQCHNGLVQLKLSAPLTVGDGLEIWVTKGGRLGFTVDQIQLAGTMVAEAAAGQIVTLHCPGQAWPGDRVFKTHDVKMMTAARESYQQQQLLPLVFRLTAHNDCPLVLEAENAAGQKVCYESDYLPKSAEKHPADRESVLKQLDRLGGSGWQLQQLDLDLGEGLLLPASVLNNARREVLLLLEEAMLASYARPAVSLSYPRQPSRKKIKECRLAVWADDYAGAKAAATAGADLVYLGGAPRHGLKSFTEPQLADLANQAELCYVLPRIATEQELPGWQKRLAALSQGPIKSLLCGNAWGVELAQAAGWTKGLRGDSGLNLFNTLSGEAWQERGLVSQTLSYELNWQEIEGLGGTFRREALAHGNLELMESAHCPLGALGGNCSHDQPCSKACRESPFFSFTDEKGYRFPAYGDLGCRMHLFNAHKLCMIEDLPRFVSAGIDTIRLDLRFLTPTQVNGITACYHKALARILAGLPYDEKKAKEELLAIDPSKLTKGHYYRGVE